MTNLVSGERYNWNKPRGKCPACNSIDKPRSGVLVERTNKLDGSKFLGCSLFPQCKYATGSYSKR